MIIKLRVLNGVSYLLIKKDIKDLLNIKDEVELTLENDKLVITKVKEGV